MRKLICVLLLLLSFCFKAHSNGIIIGFDTSIVSIFKYKDAEQVKVLAENVALKYDRVIIHLGRKYPFTKSYFSDENCKNNLRIFCDLMHAKNVKVYLWLLDSFGNENFNKLYSEHRDIIDDAISRLQTYNVYYDGMVVDLEWINYEKDTSIKNQESRQKKKIIKNNSKFINVLKYMRSKINNKELFAFVPIIENRKVNSSRGYDMKNILKYADNVIAMLYVINSDLCKSGDMHIQPCMNDSRINELRSFFKKKNILTAISLNQGIITKNDEGTFVFSKPVRDETDEIFNKLMLSDKDNYKNYEVKQYNSITDFEFVNEEGVTEKVEKEENVYYIKFSKSFLKKDDFIWEYSLVEDL